MTSGNAERNKVRNLSPLTKASAVYLVQLLLPLYDNQGQPLPKHLYQQIGDELVAEFGGLTAYSRAPAQGLWQENEAHIQQDDLIVYEVITEHLDRAWWTQYRTTLEARLEQKELLIRAQQFERL